MAEMNHNINYFYRTIKSINYALITLFISSLISPLFALDEPDNQQDIPKAFFGAGADSGYYDVNHKRGNGKWDPGFGVGGGIIFENMFNPIFGIHSGIWFSYIEMDFTMEDSGDESSTETTEEQEKGVVKSNFLTMPFYLLTSADFNFICISLLTGFNFSYITESFLSMKDEAGINRSTSILQYVGHYQIGAGGGLEIKIRITRFTRLFITGTGEYYFTELIDADPVMSDYLFDFRVRAGMLLCTF